MTDSLDYLLLSITNTGREKWARREGWISSIDIDVTLKQGSEEGTDTSQFPGSDQNTEWGGVCELLSETVMPTSVLSVKSASQLP